MLEKELWHRIPASPAGDIHPFPSKQPARNACSRPGLHVNPLQHD